MLQRGVAHFLRRTLRAEILTTLTTLHNSGLASHLIPDLEGGTLFAPLQSQERTPNLGCNVLSITALYLLLVIVLPLALSLAMAYRGLPSGRACPLCAGETLRLQSRWLRYARLTGRRQLHSRWCPRCGWEGVARVTELPEQRRTTVIATTSGAQTIELSEVSMDGSAWRVLLQAWSEQGAWRGQLLFVGPVGRVVSDGLTAFSGATYHDVLTQAMGLSETVLTVRLRSVMSE